MIELPVTRPAAGAASGCLDPLLEPLAGLPGVGPVVAKRLREAVGDERVLDLLFHLPERYARRIAVASPAEAPPEAEVILRALVVSQRAARSQAGRPYVEVRAESAGLPLLIRFMNSWPAQIANRLPEGTERLFAGKVKAEGNRFSMINPLSATVPEGFPVLEPVWPLVKGLTLAQVARAMARAMERLPELPEWHDAALARREGWSGFSESLRLVQAPGEAPPPPAARARLAYDEVMAGQLALGLVRRRVRLRPGRALAGDGTLRDRALATFGHPMTPSQAAALAEIDADLAAPTRMLRLLQGDVGSGKTLVAVLAMLRAVEAGAQGALMAPTELLARQHLRTLVPLCLPAGVRVELLAGSVKGTQRKRVLAGLAEGSVKIVVGTHALFQEGVQFRDLGLAVVDEQHRFGVAQRLLLAEKGASADLLVMTATPIPRTLLLTQWGEMAVSRLHGKPAGRLGIITRLISRDRKSELLERLKAAFAAGEKAYWITRAIEEGGSDEVAAEETFADLAQIFGDRIRLAHGRQDLAQREAALADFAAGRADLLVATTVVEVGVDVPDATIMVIEQAERFGLAALHQLRGRVGRGNAQSFCLLFHGEPRSAAERERLLILRDTEDGFVIADQDFRLRGGGDALGTRQSGDEVFRLALQDTEAQTGLLLMANRDAALLLEKDPNLSSSRGLAARLLLRLFDRSEAMMTAG